MKIETFRICILICFLLSVATYVVANQWYYHISESGGRIRIHRFTGEVQVLSQTAKPDYVKWRPMKEVLMMNEFQKNLNEELDKLEKESRKETE